MAEQEQLRMKSFHRATLPAVDAKKLVKIHDQTSHLTFEELLSEYIRTERKDNDLRFQLFMRYRSKAIEIITRVSMGLEGRQEHESLPKQKKSESTPRFVERIGEDTTLFGESEGHADLILWNSFGGPQLPNGEIVEGYRGDNEATFTTYFWGVADKELKKLFDPGRKKYFDGGRDIEPRRFVGSHKNYEIIPRVSLDDVTRNQDSGEKKLRKRGEPLIEDLWHMDKMDLRDSEELDEATRMWQSLGYEALLENR